MCEQTEIQYLDSEVVWVKLGSCWWPSAVVGFDKLPPDVLPSFRKPPIAVVKFFQEDTYEYVKNINSIYKYNCSRKDEFIKKGLDMYRSKRGRMEKFPEDVIRAEKATGGDEEILTRDQFQEIKKESYAGLFGDTPKKTFGLGKRARAVKDSHAESPKVLTPARKFTKGNSDYKVHILLQGSKSTPQPSELSTPSTSRAGSEPSEDKSETAQKVDKPISSVTSTPVASSSGVYTCHACNFSTSRLNVMILHNKSHSVTFTAYTPSPVRKKPPTKLTPKTLNTPKTPKAKKPRKEKTETEVKKPQGLKRSAEDKAIVEVKKIKTDEEIKSSLLADWDDGDEESIEEASPAAGPASPQLPHAAESSAGPLLTGATLPGEPSHTDKKSEDLDTDKPEAESDSKYEFCEDEPDWPETADVGRKIPRVKRKENAKSVSLDEDDVAREVAELLNKTTVPELPSAPEQLKIEENFPEPTIVKSPDKESELTPKTTKPPEKSPEKHPTKSIFKTKTFFRSRHSRSQDAIGKYVAEQLNAVERMNTSECDLNGSDAEASPEARESPPLVRNSPPVVRESLLVARDSIPVVRNSSPVYDSQPVVRDYLLVARDSLPVVRNSPLALRDSPSPVRDSPPVVRDSPPVVRDFPSMVRKSPVVVRNCPLVEHESPLVLRDSPPLVRDSQPVVHDSLLVMGDSMPVMGEPPLKRDSPPVIRSSPLVMYDSAPAIRNSPLVMNESPPVMCDSPLVIGDSQPVMRDTAPVIPNSPLVMEDSPPVIRNSSLEIGDSPPVMRDSMPVIRNSPLVIGDSPSVMHESGLVIRDSAPLVRNTPLVIGDSPPVMRDSAPVIRNSPLMISDSPPVMRDSAPVIRKSPLVTGDSPPVMRDSPPVMRDAPPVKRDSAPMIRKSALVIGDSPPVMRDSPPMVRNSSQVIRDSMKVVRDSPPVVHDSLVFNRESPLMVSDSPPVETVKVARLAPKIQLKKMKAQLAEREKNNCDYNINLFSLSNDTLGVTTSLNAETASEPIKYTITEKTEVKIDNVQNIDDNKSESSVTPDDPEIISNEIKKDTTETERNVTIAQESTDTNQFTEETVECTELCIDKENNELEIQDMPTDLLSTEDDLPKVQNKSPKLFMSESTASAVDALLSVSRDADRVTENIGNDPPEDLFEDDKMEIADINGVIEQVTVSNGIEEQLIEEQVVAMEEVNESETLTQLMSNGEKEQVPEFEEVMEVELDHQGNEEEVTTDSVSETVPSESDLQIAEALMNLPSTALKNKAVNDLENQIQPISFESQEPEREVTCGTSLLKNNFEIELPSENTSLDETETETNDEDIQSRFQSDQEQSENFNAAQSLVQMSEAFERKMKKLEKKSNVNEVIVESTSLIIDKLKTTVETKSVEQEIALMSESAANKCEPITKATKYETTSSKLLKMLEEPCGPKVLSNQLLTTKIVTPVHAKEKILNLDVANSPLKTKSQSPKQKIIIRRTAPSKNLINNISESTRPEKIVLSRSTKSADSAAVQTYTIQASPGAGVAADANTIVIQHKLRKVVNTPPKLQKIKPLTSIVAVTSEPKKINQPTTTDDTLFDINSMPIVLSDDILTPENIEKMPIVMSDGNIITNPTIIPSPSKPMKPKQTMIEPEKVTISTPSTKTELKTLLINPAGSTHNENKATPNILSKSSKMRGTRMLVIDKTTGKQKIIMTKAEPTKTVKEVAHKTIKEVAKIPTKAPNMGQITGKGEKFILLPTSSSPRPGRTQKIVIDPHSGKAHVLVGKSEPSAGPSPGSDKPVSAKLAPAEASGGTVMIITNAQGTQSRIVLTPEHEKLLFPNKQQNVTQIKAIAQRQVTQPSPALQKPHTIVAAVSAPAKPPTRILSKQKSAIITSKGQLIVGGRVATTVQNISPMPEARPVQAKRIVAAEPKKIIQTVQKTAQEPLIFLQQKSGAVMQLTAAQFEHLQRTGQIVQKIVAPAPPPHVKEKIVVQKSVTITSNEQVLPLIQRQQKVRARAAGHAPSPAKKLKKEMTLTSAAPSAVPAAAPSVVCAAVPPLAPISHCAPTAYQDLGNIEELLPSTAIVRHQEPARQPPPPPPAAPALPPPAPAPAPEPESAIEPEPAAPLAEAQLMAVPGENFGGPPGTFYLCFQNNGTFTSIDNRPLVLENNQLRPIELAPPERRDILEAALANSDVFHEAPAPQPQPPPPPEEFRDLNANVPVLCRVSETSTTLHQPIMTPVEVPSSEPALAAGLAAGGSLEDGLAVIGVSAHTVPTSLELPITVTDPRIAAQPMSMPLLGEEEPGRGSMPSMPILTDEAEAADSPASLEDAWSRRLLTPGSDCSDASAEIPLQPPIQISVGDIGHDE